MLSKLSKYMLINGASSLCTSSCLCLFRVFISLPVPDAGPISFPASCGGAIPLTHSYPDATLSSLLFNQNATNHDFDCQWIITTPPGEQIQLSWLDVNIVHYSSLSVYDNPSDSSSYQYMYLYSSDDFAINISPHISTGSGLILRYDDQSNDLTTSGFHIHLSLRGNASKMRVHVGVLIRLQYVINKLN